MSLRIQPEELVPGTKYKIVDPNFPILFKFMESKFDKIGTFVRVAYRLNGVWYYLFLVEGKRRFFTSNCPFYTFIT